MNFRPMISTPSTRTEFERNFHILKEKIRNKQLSLPSNFGHDIDGLKKLRYLPNRRVDFLTVNEPARLMANTMANMENWDLPDIKSEDSEEESDNM